MAFVVALIPAAFGWMMLVVLVMLIGMSGHLSCTAHRGETYRRCVRDDDLGSLELQGQILGLAVAAFALVLVGLLQSRSARCLRGWGLGAMIAAGSLLAASLLGWILGVGGLWAPDRPLPYDPVSVARGSGIMLGGAVRGLMVGALVAAPVNLGETIGFQN